MRENAASETAETREQGRGRARFELLRDKSGHIRFRYVLPSGEIVFSSQEYASRSEALKAIDSIKRSASTASVAEKKSSLVNHILSGPEWPEEMYDAVERRSKTPNRPPIDF